MKASVQALATRWMSILAIPACLLGAADEATAQTASSDSLTIATTVSLLGEGTISRSQSESAPTFTPDGKTIYYLVTNRAFTRMTIVTSNWKNGRWSKPTIAPFSGVWTDGSPAMKPDGSRMYFISNRPVSGIAPSPSLHLWYVDRQPTGSWAEPRHADVLINTGTSISYLSVAADGSLYLGQGGGLYHIQCTDGVFTSRTRLSFGDDSTTYGNPGIAPDQRFIVLMGPGARAPDSDLFISYSRNGTWTSPRRLSGPINTVNAETGPSISSDGKRLYFASERVDRNAYPWPRPKRISTYAALETELSNSVQNGVRNIFVAEITVPPAP
jgi:Tol biopolymer transport system component